MTPTSPALRYHGAKWRLAPKIIPLMPEHITYVEPYGGAAGVLLQKPRSYAEIYNDLDGDIVNFFRVLQDPATRDRLIELLVLTPYSRAEFQRAWENDDCPIERARRIAVRASMGFGSAGASKGSTGFRIDCKSRYSTAQHVWARYPDGIRAVGERMAGVLIENRPALDLIRQHDAPDTLHFVDPPYLAGTRHVRNARNAYRHEMSDDDHVELLDQLNRVDGMVILCGYRSQLYTDRLANWRMTESRARISAGRGAGIRTEVTWLNPAAVDALGDRQVLALTDSTPATDQEVTPC